MIKFIDSEGCVTKLIVKLPKVIVKRGKGYSKENSVACELTDTGNGYIAKFPAHGSTDQDQYISIGYDDARSLVLALSPHAKDLGFTYDS